MEFEEAKNPRIPQFQQEDRQATQKVVCPRYGPVPGTDLGKHCSFTEWRAEKAERELIRIKMLRYMAERIGEEMDSIITGVESFGMFCQT